MEAPASLFWHTIASAERAGGGVICGVDCPLPKWVKKRDWRAMPLIALREREARILIVFARKPGNGAFRRLVDGIATAGLRPVVVCPIFATMPAILRHWDWRQSDTAREEWSPPAAAEIAEPATARVKIPRRRRRAG